jgi:hypothetical protein
MTSASRPVVGLPSTVDGLQFTAVTLEGLAHPVLGAGHGGVDDAGLLHKLEELVGELDGDEGGGPDGRVLLRLAAEGWILHEAVDEDGEVVLDLGLLDFGPPLVLLPDDGRSRRPWWRRWS